MDTLAADRLRRALRRRPPVGASTASRRCGSAARSVTRCASGSTASRSRRARLTVADVEDALERENVELPAGRIESTDRDFTLRVQRGYREPADFAQLTLAKGEDGYLVRLGDVARVERASEERRAYFRSNGEPNIGLGIVKTSTANSLDVARAARATAEEIQKTPARGHAASSSPSTARSSSTPRSSACSRRCSRRSRW